MLAFLEEEIGERSDLSKVPDISALTDVLVSFAYPELRRSKIEVSWGRLASYALVQWGHDRNEITIRFSREVRTWHEAGILGLICHELSHPAQIGDGMSELGTDEDVIIRGLGPYLAVERVYAGKYEDHVIQHGKDRYIGYRSIRAKLTNLEIEQLDTLLSEIGLLPSKPPSRVSMRHDVVILNEEKKRILTVEGHRFRLPLNVESPDIKLVQRNGVTYVYADETQIGEFESVED